MDRRPYPAFGKAYTHNGYFKSLDAVIEFYNLRDVLPVCDATSEAGAACFPPPEVGENIERTRIGDLHLTSTDQAKLVLFLKTLDDGITADPAVP